MKQQPIDLQEDFLANYPDMVKLAKEYSGISKLGGAIIIISAFVHMANFTFFESLELFIIMIIAPIIILLILTKARSKNYIQDFDSAFHDYIPNLLELIDNASLKYKGYNVEISNSEIKQLGFLHEEIHSSFKPVGKHFIHGTYKNMYVEIFELDYKHYKRKSQGLNLGWKSSTVISFDYEGKFKDELSLYVKKSRHYRRINRSSIPSVHQLYKMVKLDNERIITDLKPIDYSYLARTSNHEATKELLTDAFSDKLLSFHKHNYRIKGDLRKYDAKFFSISGSRISIVIFNRKFLYPRTTDIFESYIEEINSVLHFVDIFSKSISRNKTNEIVE